MTVAPIPLESNHDELGIDLLPTVGRSDISPGDGTELVGKWPRVAPIAEGALEDLQDGGDARRADEAPVAERVAEVGVENGFARGTAGAARKALGSERDVSEIPDELVAAAMVGDRDAVDRLLETVRPLVVRYCRRRWAVTDRSPLSADDIAQEVCMAVLAALPGFRMQGTPFLAFVYAIAWHKGIDAHRAATRRRIDPLPKMSEMPETTEGPEQRALQGELSGRLQAMLDALSERQRDIVVLRIVVGLSVEETAHIVGGRPGAVRVTQHRALRRLRQAMPPDLSTRAR